MSLVIIKNLVPSAKYSIKCPYLMTPEGICIHNTANDASAENEIAYMLSNNLDTSFHYATDDIEIVQGIEENRNSWHAGDGRTGTGNRRYISIEICYSKSGGDRFIKAEKMAVHLVVQILKRYGWGMERIKKHQDFSGKYCPHRTLDMGWQRFLNMVSAELNPPPVEPPVVPVVYPFEVGVTIYPLEDLNLVKTAGYSDQTPLLLLRGTPCKVIKYHEKNGLYMALADSDGVFYSSAWSNEFTKFSLIDPFMDENKELKEQLRLLQLSFDVYKEEQVKITEGIQKQLDDKSLQYNTVKNENKQMVTELRVYRRFKWLVDWLDEKFPEKAT